MKKIWIVLTVILMLTALCLTGCNSTVKADTADAAAVFTLDVNPGVRVYVGEDGKVIEIEATNEDGEAVITELKVEGKDFETVVEMIIDEMCEQGYIEGESGSVLLSLEKKAIDISEKLNEKINEAFEKRGKKAAVIEQELDELGAEVERTIEDIAKKHKISRGKAHLIEKIREEFPELSEEELAKLKVNDLGMMLDETSDAVKEKFKKIEKPDENEYIGKEAALQKALESLELVADATLMQRVRFTREDGKMIYEVKFVCNGMEYEIEIDAESGEILESESEEFEEFNPEDIINDFCNKHKLDLDKIKEQFARPDGDKKHENDDDEREKERPLSRGELLEKAIAALGISEESLRKTEIRIYETDEGVFYGVTLKIDDGVYKLIAEAYSGTLIKAELNGEAIELPAEAPAA